MKNVKSIFRIQLLLAILLCMVNPLFSSENEVKDRFEKTYKIAETDMLVLNMYDSDLQINTWSSSEIKLVGEILISGGDKDDVDKILNSFKNPSVVQGAGRIEINPVFTEGTTQIMGFYKKTKLSNGESVSVSSLKANYTIWIPESIAFKLTSKYNSVKAANLLGKLEFDLYNTDLDMGDFGDNSTFDAKYSTIHTGKGKDVQFDVYDTKLYTDDLKKVIITSKYSSLTSKAVNLLVIESYNDNLSIDNLNGVDIRAEYTSLKAKGSSNIGKFKLYNCNVDVEDCSRVEYDSKYSEFNAKRVGTFTIKSSYNDIFGLNEVSDFSCDEAKYCKVNIGFLQSSINLSGTYDSSIKIDRAGTNFLRFKGDFKYGSVRMVMAPALNYKLAFENTYGDVVFPKERFSKKTLSPTDSDSKTQFEGSTDPNAKCEITFTAYDTDFTIE